MKGFRAFIYSAAAICFIAAANYFIHANPPATEPLAPVAAVSQEIAAADISGEKLASSELLLVHTQTRPLFSPTRRKWVEPAQPVPAAPPSAAPPVPAEPPRLPQPAAAETPPPEVALIGIEMTPSGSKALLLKAGASDALWFKSGEKLEGWAVQKIDAGSVEITLGGRKIKLELYPPLPAPGLQP
jgi:hypothetical protein